MSASFSGSSKGNPSTLQTQSQETFPQEQHSQEHLHWEQQEQAAPDEDALFEFVWETEFDGGASLFLNHENGEPPHAACDSGGNRINNSCTPPCTAALLDGVLEQRHLQQLDEFSQQMHQTQRREWLDQQDEASCSPGPTAPEKENASSATPSTPSAAAATARRHVLRLLREQAQASVLAEVSPEVLVEAVAAAAAEGRPAGRAFAQLGAIEGALVLQTRKTGCLPVSLLASAADAFRTLRIPHTDLLVCNIPSIVAALEEALQQLDARRASEPAAEKATAQAAAASKWALPLLECFTAARVAHKTTQDLLLRLLLLPPVLQQLQLPQLASLAVCAASQPLLEVGYRRPTVCLLTSLATRVSEILKGLPEALQRGHSGGENHSSTRSEPAILSKSFLPPYGSFLGPLPSRSAAFLVSAFSRIERWEEPPQEAAACMAFRDRLLLELLPPALCSMTAWELGITANALKIFHDQLETSSSRCSSSSSSSKNNKNNNKNNCCSYRRVGSVGMLQQRPFQGQQAPCRSNSWHSATASATVAVHCSSCCCAAVCGHGCLWPFVSRHLVLYALLLSKEAPPFLFEADAGRPNTLNSRCFAAGVRDRWTGRCVSRRWIITAPCALPCDSAALSASAGRAAAGLDASFASGGLCPGCAEVYRSIAEHWRQRKEDFAPNQALSFASALLQHASLRQLQQLLRGSAAVQQLLLDALHTAAQGAVAETGETTKGAAAAAATAPGGPSGASAPPSRSLMLRMAASVACASHVVRAAGCCSGGSTRSSGDRWITAGSNAKNKHNTRATASKGAAQCTEAFVDIVVKGCSRGTLHEANKDWNLLQETQRLAGFAGSQMLQHSSESPTVIAGAAGSLALAEDSQAICSKKHHLRELRTSHTSHGRFPSLDERGSGCWLFGEKVRLLPYNCSTEHSREDLNAILLLMNELLDVEKQAARDPLPPRAVAASSTAAPVSAESLTSESSACTAKEMMKSALFVEDATQRHINGLCVLVPKALARMSMCSSSEGLQTGNRVLSPSVAHRAEQPQLQSKVAAPTEVHALFVLLDDAHCLAPMKSGRQASVFSPSHCLKEAANRDISNLRLLKFYNEDVAEPRPVLLLLPQCSLQQEQLHESECFRAAA
ncbi:uncharacterized protein LOC113147303 [Cyclospora cayetanensis]|uniref:Uncharacterized protein LOC113147303 n=1 Tax=Cyclospora cayetanensis TaxID=88456 RepID=A0A6P6RZ53_9EIME|nr:uncharacterized protein LOC113147303 [Cyclospora cayetanensis]